MEMFCTPLENWISNIKGIDFDQSYIPVAHADSFRINISTSSMHRLTARILDISDTFQNTNVPIHEIVCVSPQTYYLDWFEISHPNVPLNRDDGPFFLKCMNGIQGKIQAEDNGIYYLLQWSRSLNIRRS